MSVKNDSKDVECELPNGEVTQLARQEFQNVVELFQLLRKIRNEEIRRRARCVFEDARKYGVSVKEFESPRAFDEL